MTELRLAEGEEVVKSYDCAAVDSCAVFAGTVIPLRSKRNRESRMTITVTNRRVVYDMEVSGKRDSTIHQETLIENISSISALMARFGRDLRVPVLMVVLGFILIFAPYVYAVETEALSTDGDYEAGYNAGIELGYYYEFLNQIEDSVTENTIPQGYVPVLRDPFGSDEYRSGFAAAEAIGQKRAVDDATNGRSFSVPTDLMIHNSMSIWILILATVGAIVFIMGSVVYMISNNTKDWIRISIGSGGNGGPFITSISGGSERNGIGPLAADTDFESMVTDIGSLILEQRSRLVGEMAS